jgi:uncharacterized protein YecE (DUF72 family)
MRLHIGRSALRGDIARYATHFSMVELRVEQGSLPRSATLKEWAKKVSSEFVFSLVVPRSLVALDRIEHAELALVNRVSVALGARWLVLRTPATVMPGARSRRKLAELVTKLEPGERRIAWEPQGVWDPDEAEELAATLNVTLVRDLSRDEAPAGPVVYTRLRALGTGSRLTSGTAERLVDELASCEEAYVVTESDGAIRFARLLLSAFQDTGSLDEDSSDDFEDDDEAGDEAELPGADEDDGLEDQGEE